MIRRDTTSDGGPLAEEKRTGKGFCPFCGSEFESGHDTCPNCGQDIRQYNDDLGPVLRKVQDATNIDMKSPKVRVAMTVVVVALVFAGCLVIFDYIDSHNSDDSDDDSPVTEGIVVRIATNGYMDLTGDFTDGTLKVLPLYDPDLRIQISLDEGLESDYNKIIWVVKTEGYNGSNSKNPFYTKVTKIRDSDDSAIGTVTWGNVLVGRFSVTAECYTYDGECRIHSGYGTYYGKLDASYLWEYEGKTCKLSYTLSQDDVRTCLEYDLTERMDMQTRSDVADFIALGQAVSDLDRKLMRLYSDLSYTYTSDGYADFILSFVQQCFPDVPDSSVYGVEDYWAYPAETVLWGCGDDEDRAILFCALMASNLSDPKVSVALIGLPDRTVAAISLDMSHSFISKPVMIDSGGTMFTVADTDSDLGLGRLSSAYAVSSDGKTVTFHGTEVDFPVYVMEKKSNI